MNKISSQPFILVDGSSYLFRAYHALPPLTNNKGQPTGAIYGVLNMLRKLLNDYHPTHIAVVFDSKSKNFRHQMYPAYKANRTVMPNDLQSQIPPLFTAIRALGMPLIVIDGYEADDIIGTLAQHAVKQGMTVLISTGDKDLAQLVNSQVTLINTMSQQSLDMEGVHKKFGVTPAQMVDYLALTGDNVDNIPGVPGVGPKTAALWLSQYHNLDNLLKNAEAIPKKVGENLRNHIEQVLLGRQLVTINTDISLSYNIQELTLGQRDQEKLRQIFTELEFKTWLQELSESPKPVMDFNYQTISTESEFEKLLEKFIRSPLLAMVIETAPTDVMYSKLVGIAFAAPGAGAAYVPLAHDYMGAPEQLPLEWVLQKLQPIFSDHHKVIVAHQLKYILKILNQYGVKLENQLWDTLLAAYVLDSGSGRYDIEGLSLKYLAYQALSLEEMTGKGVKRLPFNQVPIEKAARYAAENAEILLKLYSILTAQLSQNEELLSVFNQIEMPLLPVLSAMEQKGVLIDAEKLREHSQELHHHLINIETEVHGLAGEVFNLSSSKQLQVILYEKLNLPILKKTPTGQPSTAEEVLQELSSEYPIPRLILTYRSLSKLKSTYTDRLVHDIHPRTGRVHTCYQQAVTSTGRLSSIEPNLQNIPIRSQEGRRIRQAFIAPPGFKILAADYSQVELRIMAHLSGDPGLLRAFAQGVDIHQATAAEVYGVELNQVSALQRRNAKAINFGLMYGMSSFGLSQQLNISREEAQQRIDLYFHRYPQVLEYMEKARVLGAQNGFVKTLFGRRVQLPDIKSSNQFRRLAAERQAINAPLQGTAADIIKLAMICIADWLRENPCGHMIMQVHDELVFEVHENEVEHLCTEVRRCMENVVKLKVPLVVDIGVGDNWDEAH